MISTHAASRLCVPVCVRRADELRGAVAQASEIGDVVELRLDCLSDDGQLERATRELDALFQARTRELILTLRPAGTQGGGRELSFEQRINFWTENFGAGRERADFADLELDLVAHFAAREESGAPGQLDWHKIICSHHDFDGLPADLPDIYARLSATPARILKLAYRARDITDSLAAMKLIERARNEGRDMIAVAMGEAGLLTRVLTPARGAFLTYGSLTHEQATAPGQVSAKDLRELYRLHALDAETQIVGLVGSPVAHSLSPHVHNAAFAACGVNAVYLLFETGDAHEFIRRMAHPQTRELAWNLRGLSVTAPHKSAVISQLDAVEASAREIGAVNTVVVEDGILRGYNTDAAAALAPLAGRIKLRGSRVAVIGAGGAARAVLWSLREKEAEATVFARDVERARPVAEQFGAGVALLDERARFDKFDLVINATPLGTRGARETETPAVSLQLRGARAAYDLVYNPVETRFMREAHRGGCEIVLGGLAMLIAQAAAQFTLWTGQAAPLKVMHAAAEKKIRESA